MPSILLRSSITPPTYETKQRNNMARLSAKTPALLDEILDLIINGKSLERICLLPGMPDAATVYRWLNRDPDFARKYSIACMLREHILCDEILEIADNCGNTWEEIARARLMIDARKWLICQFAPKKYKAEKPGASAVPIVIVEKPERLEAYPLRKVA